MKEKVFTNNPHTLQELRDNIRHEINLISRDELQRISQNVLERCEACIRQDGGTLTKVSLREKKNIVRKTINECCALV